MKIRRLIIAALLLALTAFPAGAAVKTYKLLSPSGELAIDISAGPQTLWSVKMCGSAIIEPSPLSMTLDDGTVFGKDVKVKKAVKSSVNSILTPVLYRQARVKEAYNELTLRCKGYSIVFRAYDEGAAYRFVADRKAPFKVNGEQAAFNIGRDCKAFVPYTRKSNDSFECQFFTSFESTYTRTEISKWEKGRLAFLPVTLDGPGGMKICITESDLLNYPGMYLSNEDGDTSLEAVFAPYPKDIEQGGHNMLQGLVRSREDYIAKADAGEAFPWRIVVVSKEDKDLLTCDLPWLLGRERDPGVDFSWVKPGKVAWDWWNAWNVYGVNFKSGVNNDTYKYYIDFASRNGIEYVILDEGWAVNKQADLFQVVPEIDLPELCRYAGERGVGLILWAGYWAFEKDMERACREYSAMGVKGFKVDFMDRDDQPMVDFYRRTAETAARYHLMVDFHGAFKPAGLQRTWPNVVNFEGVYGLENAKGQKPYDIDLVTYEVSIPFVRLVAGPCDYTQGAMRNATKGNFRYVSSEAMSQGTRCRQLAEYVIFDAPLTMLCDSPSNYKKERECLKFIAEVPTVWDETRALEGKAGEYVAIARRKGDTWYIGALTDWNEREMTLDLSFIEGTPLLEVFADGPNAHRAARDYKHQWLDFPEGGRISIKMAPGGGWAAILRSTPEPWQKTDSDWPQYGVYEKQNAEMTSAPKMVLFGDSITWNWERLDHQWLEEHGFVGRGISGQTTVQLLSRIRPDVIDLHPEYMALLIGTNDIARNNGYISVENCFGNIVSLVELARANGIKPILCTLCPAGTIGWRKQLGDPRPQIEQLNGLIKDYAAGHNIPLADYHSALRTPDGALDPAYALDSVHPNLAGYKVMEKVLLEAVGLKVMSFNIRNAGAKDGENSWPQRREAVAAMLRSERPDVFGIQEAYPEQEAFILENCPEYKGFGVGRDDGKDAGERMSVFYRTDVLELLDGGTWWLSETPDVPSVGWDAKYPRTATWAKLRERSSGREFYFVNTHLDHRGVEARKRGLSMVVDRVEEMTPGVPLIFTGDFNVEPGDECLLSLEGKMLDARLQAPVTSDKPSFNGYGTTRAKIIDYIYYRGFSSAREFYVVDRSFEGKPYISDHYPIAAVLGF